MSENYDIWQGCPPFVDNFYMTDAIKQWGLKNNYRWVDTKYVNGEYFGGCFTDNRLLGAIKIEDFYLTHKEEIWKDYKKKHPNAKYFGDTEYDDLLELEYTLFNECNVLLKHFEKLPDLDVSNKDNFKHHIEELKKLILMRSVIRNYDDYNR